MRKLTATVDYKLRIRESLRRQIARAAKRRGGSMNAEMARRLEQSFNGELDMFKFTRPDGKAIYIAREHIVAFSESLEDEGATLWMVDGEAFRVRETVRQVAEAWGMG